MTNRKTFSALSAFPALIALLALATLPGSVRPLYGGSITDTFDANHAYWTGSAWDVSGTIWDGGLLNDSATGTNNATGLAMDANVTNAGRLTITSTNGDWDSSADGPLLYRNVAGDFQAQVTMNGIHFTNYDSAGLIARLAPTGSQENWISTMAENFSSPGVRMRQFTNNTRTEANRTLGLSLPMYLRLERSGNVFTSSYSLNGSTWTTLATPTRNDLNGQTLQVGLIQGTFSGNSGNAQFDDFVLSGPLVPEPSTFTLAILGLLGVFGWRRRKRR